MCHRVSSQLKRPEMKTIYALRRSKVHRKDKLLNKMKKTQKHTIPSVPKANRKIVEKK